MKHKTRTYRVFALNADSARVRGIEFAIEDGLSVLDARTRKASAGAGFDFYVIVRLLDPGAPAQETEA